MIFIERKIGEWIVGGLVIFKFGVVCGCGGGWCLGLRVEVIGFV